MAVDPNHQVVAVRPEYCNGAGPARKHTVFVRLGDGSDVTAEDLIALIEAGAAYHMIPPEGAPAYEAHLASGGLPLILQVRVCDLCFKKVLFA
jgi:hypothetical protein